MRNPRTITLDVKRQVDAARSIRPSREFLAYQLTQRGLESSIPAENFTLVQRPSVGQAPNLDSLRWYLGEEMWESLRFVDKIPSRIEENSRVLVAEPSLKEILTLGKSASRVRIVGPDYYRHVEVWTGCTILWRDILTSVDRSRIRDMGADRYAAMIDDLGGADSALVFTTGPSIDDVDVKRLADENPVRIACNSIVSNTEMLSELRPNVFAFGDGAFHFGPSRYAAAFRRDLAEFLRSFSPWVLTSIEMFPILERYFEPELLERFIPVELHRRVPADAEAKGPHHLRNGNVMTTFMLPVAELLADKITFAGCDGRSPDDHGFWSHSSSAQYDDLYQTVVDAHPSFFRDADYVAYYNRHCEVVHRDVQRLTAAGTTMQTATPSYVPALRTLPGGEG